MIALPDYFQRSAAAAAQILSGFDREAIARRLQGVSVGVVAGPDASSTEGRYCSEMAVRLLARLYPRLCIEVPDAAQLRELATAINPKVELIERPCDLNLCIGSISGGGTDFFIGSDGWDAYLSTASPRPVGKSSNPLGAGAAACLGAAALFRAIFLDQTDLHGEELVFSTLELERRPSESQPSLDNLEIPSRTALVGLGAIGNGVVWALSHAAVPGELLLIDPEEVELGNLQRYAMTRVDDRGRAKARLATELLPQLTGRPHDVTWAEFCADQGYRWERVLVALDSAADRRAVQDALPRWIVNGWTQPGDLGVSVHPWTEGACLACLYLPQEAMPSEDEQVAAALGLPERRPKVRRLLVGGEPTPAELLEEAAAALQIDPEPLLAYEGRPLREIYVEGICGGAAVPLDRMGQPAADVHVPLAHQSALAGILMVSRLFADLLGHGASAAEATKLDLMRPLGEHLTRPLAKDPRGICICQDPVFKAAYGEKWAR